MFALNAKTEQGKGHGRDWLFLLLAATALVVGLICAWRLRWVCDDAFITFRYVDNLLDGKGLVFNAGERVEGYTHFLWLCLLIPFRALGLELPAAAEILGLLLLACLLLLASYVSLRLIPGTRPVVPFTALALALHHEVWIWSTGGLETMLFACEILAAYCILCLGESDRARRYLLLGATLTLSLLTRPDAAVFCAVAVGFLLVRAVLIRKGKERFRPLLLTLSPLLLLIPYGIWKLSYYGNLLPNPYYAKSAGDSYYVRGFRYLWVYFRPYLSSTAAVLGLPYLIWIMLRGGREAQVQVKDKLVTLLQDRAGASLLLAWIMAFGYAILFVARVGGDFMYARFLIPVIPFFYICLEILLRRLFSGRRPVQLLVLALLPLLLLVERGARDSLYFTRSGEAKEPFGIHGVADEHWYYTHRAQGMSLIDALEIIGRELHRYFDGRDVHVLLRGQAALGYYGRFAVCIENAGLTDAAIAHLPLAHRGRPGHERSAPYEYLLQRGVNFIFQRPPYRDDPYRIATFLVGQDPVRAEIVCYDRRLMRDLADRFPREIRFTDFEQYLDRWIETMSERSAEENRRDYQRFRDYYFRLNQDPRREERIIAGLGGRTGS